MIPNPIQRPTIPKIVGESDVPTIGSHALHKLGIVKLPTTLLGKVECRFEEA